MHHLSRVGVAYGVATFALYASCDVLVRILLQAGIGQSQVIALIMGLAMLILLAAVAIKKDWAQFKPSQPRLVALVAGMSCIEAYCCFYTFGHLNYLVEAYALFFTLPLWTALFAGLVLREHLSKRQLAAIFIGFGGVILANLPLDGATPLGLVHLIGLATPMLASLRILAMRHLSQKTGGFGLLIYIFLALTLFNTATMGSFTPLSPVLWAMVAGAALFQAGAQYCFMSAARHLAAPLVAPFQYTQVLWGVLLGIVIFGEWPKANVYAGLAIVVAAGIMLMQKPKKA